MTTSAFPRTSRPLELAGPGERPAILSTQEGTCMREQGTQTLGQANNPSGLTGDMPSYAEIVAWLQRRDAGFTHAPYCDHPVNGPHPCTSKVDAMLSSSGASAPTPSGADVSGPPVYTLSRLRNVVTGNLASVRAGVLSPTEAQNAIMRALDDFDERRRAAAALRDAEVTANAEGRVSADPPATSARAARLVEPRTGSQRARILRFVVEAPNGVTDYETARDLQLLPNSVRPRRGELADGGYVVDSGRTRRHRGSDWAVWEATDVAHAWYRRRIGGAA